MSKCKTNEEFKADNMVLRAEIRKLKRKILDLEDELADAAGIAWYAVNEIV